MTGRDTSSIHNDRLAQMQTDLLTRKAVAYGSMLPALWLLLVAAGCAPTPASSSDAVRQVAYVSVTGDGRVEVFDVDAETGEWTQKQSVAARDGAAGWELSAPMAVSPDGRRLDVGLRSAAGVATYEIAEDGRLALQDTTGIGGSAPYLVRDPSGEWLLAAYYSAGKVSVHRVEEGGTIAAGAVQEIQTAPNAHAVLVDPTNRFVFVPHTGPNAIYQFRFDAETGILSPNEPLLVQPPPGREPRHATFHPALPVVYVINERGSTITAYLFDADRGTLTEFQEVATLPSVFAGENSTADVHLTPDGRYLYGSNRGHDSIVAYRVDPATGRLQLIDWFPTEPRPRDFAIDLTGRFLYAAGQESENVAAYRIDGATGRLTRFATYPVGPAPTWIELVAIGTGR